MGLRDVSPKDLHDIHRESWIYWHPDNKTRPTYEEIENFYYNEREILVDTQILLNVCIVLAVVGAIWFITYLIIIGTEFCAKCHKPPSPVTPFKHYKQEHWKRLHDPAEEWKHIDDLNEHD